MSKTTKVTIPGPTAQETELQEIQIQLAQQQLEQTQLQSAVSAPALERLAQEQEFRNELFTPEEQKQQLREQFEFEQEFRPIQQELLQRELERIRRGPGASEEEIRLIGEATEQAIGAGESDISEFRRLGLTQIREELAPASGLRPTDSPIVDRGLQLGREAERQQGQLVRNLRGAQAQAQLNFPLAQQQFAQAQAFGAQQLGQAAIQFQTSLRQQAFQNQLRLAGGASAAGASALGGVSQGLGISQLPRLAQSTSRITGISGGEIAAGIAGVAQGAGAAFAGSSRRFKNSSGPVDVQKVLEAVRNLDVDNWKYRDVVAGENTEFAHMGPYAEDFEKAFGLDTGDGTYIRTIDALGVLFAAVKALAMRQEELSVGTA